jgi:hypothetical protein
MIVGVPGIEPGLHAPEARVLPVYYTPRRSIKPFSIMPVIYDSNAIINISDKATNINMPPYKAACCRAELASLAYSAEIMKCRLPAYKMLFKLPEPHPI